jgi:hypothetical protein
MSSSLTEFQAAQMILASHRQRSRCGMPRPCHSTVLFDQYRLVGGALAQRTSREPGRNRCEGLVLPFAWPLSRGRLGLLGRGVAGLRIPGVLRVAGIRRRRGHRGRLVHLSRGFRRRLGHDTAARRDAAAGLLDIDLGGGPCRRDVCCAKVRAQSTPVMIEIAAIEIILKDCTMGSPCSLSSMRPWELTRDRARP